jgi:hypothetical protein
MNTESIVMCVVALILGMLMANMLKNVCGCKVVEGLSSECTQDLETFCAMNTMYNGSKIEQVNPDDTSLAEYDETPCAMCVKEHDHKCHENDGKEHCLTKKPSGTCNCVGEGTQCWSQWKGGSFGDKDYCTIFGFNEEDCLGPQSHKIDDPTGLLNNRRFKNGCRWNPTETI